MTGGIARFGTPLRCEKLLLSVDASFFRHDVFAQISKSTRCVIRGQPGRYLYSTSGFPLESVTVPYRRLLLSVLEYFKEDSIPQPTSNLSSTSTRPGASQMRSVTLDWMKTI